MSNKKINPRFFETKNLPTIFTIILGGAIFVLFVAILGGVSRRNADSSAVLSPATVRPVTTATIEITGLTDAALAVVGFDDGGQAPSPNDPRVKQAISVIRFLATETNQKPYDIGFALDSTVQTIESTYGKSIKRQQLLEAFRTFYVNGDEKTKTNIKTEKITNTIKLFAILKYGK